MNRTEFVEIIAAAELLRTSFGEWLLQRFDGKCTSISPGAMGTTVEQGVAGGLAQLAGSFGGGTLPILHGEIMQITSSLPETARIDVDKAWYGKAVPLPSDSETRFIVLLVSALGKVRRITEPQPVPAGMRANPAPPKEFQVPKVTDPVVEANRELLRERSASGIEKYRTTLAASGLSREQLLQHLLEELLDAANYTQAVLQTPAAPPRRVVAWRMICVGPEDTEIFGGWQNGDSPDWVDETMPGLRIERAYSE